MSNKVTYASLKLKPNYSVKEIDFNGTKIEVNQYLDTPSKYDVIMVTLQKSKENGYYNPLKIDMYFHLNLVYMYSNLTFTEKQREDEAKLYDTMASTGLLLEIIKAIPENEYEDLLDFLNETIEAEMDYNKSIGAVVGKIIQDLPTQAAAAAEILDTFDPAKFKNVVDFARAANGGRDIKLNTPIEDPTGPMLTPAT